jgi:hypothetical protein
MQECIEKEKNLEKKKKKQKKTVFNQANPNMINKKRKIPYFLHFPPMSQIQMEYNSTQRQAKIIWCPNKFDI